MSLKDLLKKNKDKEQVEDKQPTAADSSSTSQDKKQPAGDKPMADSKPKNDNASASTADDKAYQILLKPLITEKLSSLSEEGKYAFVVDSKANKVEIAKAIKAVYGIWPEKVNVMNYQGKRVRFGRVFGRRRNWKKAIITLPKGKTIDIYKGV